MEYILMDILDEARPKKEKKDDNVEVVEVFINPITRE